MSWSSCKKKEGSFCTVSFVQRKFFEHICFISMYIVLNIHTFTYQKTLLHTLLLFCLFFKIVESLHQCILKKRTFRLPKILRLKSFDNFGGNWHVHSLMIMIQFRFICDEEKLCQNIKRCLKILYRGNFFFLISRNIYSLVRNSSI